MAALEELYTAMEQQKLPYLGISKAALAKVVDREEPLLGFLVNQGAELGPEGTYHWQKVGVLTKDKLMFWLVNEVAEDEEESDAAYIGANLETALRVFPLRSIAEVNQRVAYSKEGVALGINLTMLLHTLDSAVATEEQILVLHDTLRISGNGEMEGGSIEEVMEFGYKISKALK